MRRKTVMFLASASACVALVAACFDWGVADDRDASGDAGPGADGGIDARMDAADTGTDVFVAEAGDAAEAGPPVFVCPDGTTCTLDRELCCGGAAGYSCVDVDGGSCASTNSLYCAGSAECSAGLGCCLSFPGPRTVASCNTPCTMGTVCRTPADCPKPDASCPPAGVNEPRQCMP